MRKSLAFPCLVLTFILGCSPLAWGQGHLSLPYDVSLLAAHFAEAAVAGTPAAPALPCAAPFWVDMVNAEADQAGGEGVYVAVLDTGLLANWQEFFPHARICADLGKGFSYDIQWDPVLQDLWVSPLDPDRGFITKPYEGSGHGTHVASTIVGYRFQTSTADLLIRGVAPKVNLIPVLVLDAWEIEVPGADEPIRLAGGSDEMIAAGIYYVADLAATKKGRFIINMSLGGPDQAPLIEQAVNYAIARGVIVVASAGNDGYNGMGYPGAYAQVISAAAGGWTLQWLGSGTDPRWWLSQVPEKLNTPDYLKNNWQMYLEDFSSRPAPWLGQSWKQLDVCAPGASIVGPFKDYFSTEVGYFYLWGTSMAAPHVSAIAALVAQRNPRLTQAAMENVLTAAATGIPLASDGALTYNVFLGELYPYDWRPHEYGRGWLTVDQALSCAGKTAK